MQPGKIVLVCASLERGAFSGERVFELAMQDSVEPYVGITSVDHCRDSDRKKLDRDQPKPGSKIEGFIEAFLISNGGEQARIELPDGEAIRVATSKVRFQLRENSEASYVPVGS